jgi:hypothetical protein
LFWTGTEATGHCRGDALSGAVVLQGLAKPWWRRLRGELSLFAGHAFVGLSQIRETALFGGLPLQETGQELRCGLALVDLSNGELAGLFWFHSGVEEVFAVAVLPGYGNPGVIGPDTSTDESQTVWMVPSQQH